MRELCHPSGQIEQGAHYIRISLIYSTRKAFVEKVVVELVYKFDEKSYCKCFKGESIAKVRFNFLGGLSFLEVQAKAKFGMIRRGLKQLFVCCCCCWLFFLFFQGSGSPHFEREFLG